MPCVGGGREGRDGGREGRDAGRPNLEESLPCNDRLLECFFITLLGYTRINTFLAHICTMD